MKPDRARALAERLHRGRRRDAGRQWSTRIADRSWCTQTAIFGKALAGSYWLGDTLGEEEETVYRAQIAGVRDLVQKTADDAAPVEVLARTVAKALTVKKPKSRYLAGHGAEAAAALARRQRTA